LVLAGLVLVALPFSVAAKAKEEDLARVKVGMDRSEVLQIMGKPKKDQPVREEELCRLYVYKKVGRYRVVNIWFDCDDKVQGIDKVR
jgi:outer membrane protein assembly factor BamE (lipoprotein component of BamABCDE complex)